MTILGNKVLADIVTLITALSHYDWFCIRMGHLGTDMCPQGEGHVKMKAEIKVMPLQATPAQDCQ